MRPATLVYTEIDTQYARLVHQEAVIFQNIKAANNFMERMYERTNEQLGYNTYGSIGEDYAELNSPRTNKTYYWVVQQQL